jgi:hypothetical protein
MHLSNRDAPIEQVRARTYMIPTDKPEADGTFVWNFAILSTM